MKDEALRHALRNLADEVMATNMANGWFEERRSFAEGIALLHSEVSEAFEAFRDHGLADATRPQERGVGAIGILPKPEGVGSEMADILIRLLDECDRQAIDLVFETRRKLDYNKTRGYRHGGKVI